MAYDNNNYSGGGQGRNTRRQGLNVSSQSLSAMPRSPAEALEPSRGPEPPKNMKKKRQLHPFLVFLNGVITLFLIGAAALIGGVYFTKYQIAKEGPLTYSTVVDIRKGMGTRQIASKLQDEGVISHQIFFILSWMFVYDKPSLKAGEYAISKGASINKVLDQLIRGKSIFYKITVPEGFTSQMVVKRINTHPKLKGYVREIPPEGSLLPDTYTYSNNTDRNDIIRRMQAAQNKLMQKAWKNRAGGLPLKSPQEALILASIVEKETGQAGERDRVAGVFVNRLRKRMRLQSDPTIIYGLVGGQGTLGRPIYKSDIRSKTPYNTYHIRGLPPTPIANPGKAAILAVLNPARTKDLYFVADGTGGHVFAPTLKKHNENVRNWRKVEKEIRKRQAEAKAKEEAEQAAQNKETGSQDIKGNVKPSSWAPESKEGGDKSQKETPPLPEKRP